VRQVPIKRRAAEMRLSFFAMIMVMKEEAVERGVG
jgi:hypothetical protein